MFYANMNSKKIDTSETSIEEIVRRVKGIINCIENDI